MVGVVFKVQSVNLKTEEQTDKRNQGSIDLIACPINPYIILITWCVEESDGRAPLIGSTRVRKVGGWVVMAGVVAAPPYTWCFHSTSVLITVSLVPCKSLYLSLQDSNVLHYTSVYMIHFSLSASYSMTNTAVSQNALSYQCILSGSRIRRDVYTNRNSLCLCVSVCVVLFLAVWPLQAGIFTWDSRESVHRGQF